MTILKVEQNTLVGLNIDFTMEICCNCGIPFMVPTYKHRELVSKKGTSFYCPNGHGQHYSGPTEAQKLKEQLEEERKRAEIDKDSLTNRLLDVMNEKKKVDNKLKRLTNGVCPCCNRSFCNLANHMKKKHPEEVSKLR